MILGWGKSSQQWRCKKNPLLKCILVKFSSAFCETMESWSYKNKCLLRLLLYGTGVWCFSSSLSSLSSECNFSRVAVGCNRFLGKEGCVDTHRLVMFSQEGTWLYIWLSWKEISNSVIYKNCQGLRLFFPPFSESKLQQVGVKWVKHFWQDLCAHTVEWEWNLTV